MHNRKYLTQKEAAEVERLAIDLVSEKCRTHPGYLVRIVKSYVGSAEAASEAVVLRCESEPAYLESILQSYFAGLSEREILDELSTVSDAATVTARLGFDPFDVRRKEAFRLASQFLNERPQVITLAIAALLFLLMVFFPPWQMVRKVRVHECDALLCKPDQTVEVQFAGYRFCADPPAGSSSDQSGSYIVYRIYWEMLLIQLLGVVIVTVGFLAALRDKRSFEARVAALPAGRAPAVGLPTPWVEEDPPPAPPDEQTGPLS